MEVAEKFKALGDPFRLTMIERLASGNPFTIGAVSHGLGITRQGARKHLQVLADAQIITFRPAGRDVIVQLEPAALDDVKAYLTELERLWDQRLDALRRFVEEGRDLE